ncbi:MAG: glycosyl hydrolase [Rhodospirillales bacterium]|nr:glycosyl hydrolase [Rhodospirillales bacterium]
MADITTYLSPGGEVKTSGDGPATRIVVATLNGVATLRRQAPGAPWALTGRSLEDLHVGSLVYEDSSGKLFAGAHDDGGLWVSDDGQGASWRPLTNGLDRPHVYSLAARRIGGSGGDHVTIFLGASPAALNRSDDLGESWIEITSIRDVADTDKWTFPPPPHIPHVKQIVFHPTEPETLYVLVEQGAFLKSVDDGRSWTDLTAYAHPDDENYRDPHRLVIKPDDPDIFYLATGVGVYRSADGGASFDRLTRRGDRVGYPDFVFVDPTDGRTIYMGGSPLNPPDWYANGFAGACIMRSADEGKTWLELDHGMPKPMVGAFQAMTQHVWNGGMMLIVGSATGEIYDSEDRGASWERISDEATPISKGDHHLPFLSEEIRLKGAAERGV